jgi:SAM-dependent MidA family methyltransferase
VDDPFRNVGDQDITAHVNFSALRKWSEEAGLQTLGFTAQGPYLISLGIDRVVSDLLGDEPDSHEITKVKGLILPQGMGESHKVMVSYRVIGAPVLRGFGLRNMLRKL